MNWKQYTLIIIWLVGAFMYAEYANATDYRIVTIANSKHFSDSDRYNENHDGLGGEMRIGEESWLGIIPYTNSFNDPATLFYYAHEHEITPNFGYGFQWGYADGYSDPLLFAAAYTNINIAPQTPLMPSLRLTVSPVVAWSGLFWEVKF